MTRPKTLGCCTALFLCFISYSFGQPVCPLPPSNNLCASLQTSQCITTVTGTQCRPRVVIFDPAVPGGLVAVDCTCFGPNDCGPLEVVGTDIRCTGVCPTPPAGNLCQVYVNGVPSGQPFVAFATYPPGTQFSCGCNPDQPTCLPQTGGQGCQQTQCPNANEFCLPRCVRVGATGLTTVIDCDCRPTFECHVVPGTPQPICQGQCPPGQICVRTETPQPDGSTIICCDCQDPPDICEPDPVGPGCRPVTCPDPSDQCRPKCILINVDGVPDASACECVGTDECHAEYTAASGPICVGNCPPGQICVQTVITTPAGTEFCCECADDPNVCEPTDDGQGCKPVQCPSTSETCKPRCVRYGPPPSIPTVLDCDCRGQNECHVEFAPGTTPFCTGKCPPGEICVETIIQNTDGTFEICCDCERPPCDCPGDIDGNGVLNGADIPGFVRCYLGIPLPTDNCTCADIDGNGIYNNIDVQHFIQRILNKADCNPRSCCLPDGLCIDLAPGVTQCPNGGTLVPGPCGVDRACCLPDGSCRPLAPVCCELSGGTVLPAGDTCAGQIQACCVTTAAGGTFCIDTDPLCCTRIYNGVPQGPGTSCQGDTNGNGVDDACEPNQECGVNPLTGQCRQVQCPVPGQFCLPTCVLVSATTQQVIAIQDCECRSTSECHIQVTGGQYSCVGGCPTPGEICVTTTTNNGDGTLTVCCRCEPETPPTCPLPTTFAGQLCAPRQNTDCTVNPTTDRQCAPRKVKWNGATGGISAELCACHIPGQCGAVDVIPATDGVNYILRCLGGCPTPPGLPCRIFVNGNAIAGNSVNTSTLPAGSIVECGCQ